MEEKKSQGKKHVSYFRFHFMIFIMVNILLFLINFMFSPFFWWAIFPFFGWLIALVLHACALWSQNLFPAKRAVIIHFGVYASTNLLLSIIDYTFSADITWALYPLIFWGTGLIIHAIVYREFQAKSEVSKKGTPLKVKDTKKRPDLRKSSKNKVLEKAESLKKRANLLRSSPPARQELNQSITPPEKQMDAKKPNKAKQEILNQSSTIDLSEEEKKELEKTESELELEEKEAICVVHKGPIVGTAYICPQCKTFYCLKCITALQEKGEKCWNCGTELNP